MAYLFTIVYMVSMFVFLFSPNEILVWIGIGQMVIIVVCGILVVVKGK